MKIAGDFSSFCFDPRGSLAVGEVGGRVQIKEVVVIGESASLVGREEGDVFKGTSLLRLSLTPVPPCS